MNKTHLVQHLTKLIGNKKESVQITNCIFSILRDALRNGDKVVISGFGSFKVVMARARRFLNPKTGRETLLEARRKIKFHPAKHFLD